MPTPSRTRQGRAPVIKADPAGAEVFTANFEKLAKDLSDLHESLLTALKELKGSDLFVFHPAFGYFADEYGLNMIAVEVGGREPSAKALARLIDEAREKKPGAIFVQPQFSSKSAKLVAKEIGGRVVVADPLAQEWLANLRQVVREIKGALQ